MMFGQTSKDERIKEVKEENEKIFQEFLEGQGKLPAGFAPFEESQLGITGTPFESYLKEIWDKVDRLSNKSGIGAWYRLDESMDINTAAAAISGWSVSHKKMNQLLSERCHIEHTYILPPLDFGWSENVMVVLASRKQFDHMLKELVEQCKAQGISFCYMLSDHELYDLIEEKKKTVHYYSYPNYHDETYADWVLL